jgi:hypothetical protein
MSRSRHFAPHELLPGLSGEETWESLDPALRAKLDDNLLETADDVRDLLGVQCSVNNYADGGKRQWCGLRTDECTIGAAHSQHRLGRAADLHPEGVTADEARARIRVAVLAGHLPHLGGVELGVSWLHIDVRPRVDGKVLEFHA